MQRINKYYFLLIWLISLFTLPLSAQESESRKFYLYGTIENFLTSEMVYGAKAELLSLDSMLINSGVVTKGVDIYDRKDVFYMEIAPDGGDFLLRMSADGYETEMKPIHVPKLSSRRIIFFAGNFTLTKSMKTQHLKDVTIKATKIKFYNRGDTVVYNADAFKLAEGSMLDALIRQLPGVELTDDGRIMQNGKQIECLILNGEEFFKGNNKIMLDNLPAYMVSNVKVYDKGGKVSEFLGKKAGDEQLVMDVVLKKNYNIGYLGNVEMGYGTKDRYLGRLFAMRFTNHSRVSAFGNINNLNDSRKPGENTEWTPDKMPSGLLATKNVGVDYLIKDRRKRYKLSGNVQFYHNKTDNHTIISGESFLPMGSNWSLQEVNQFSKSTGFSTRHDFEFNFHNRYNLIISPYINYNKGENNGQDASATFNSNPTLNTLENMLDSIRKPVLGPLIKGMTVNRRISETLGKSNAFGAGVEITNLIKLPDLLDFIEMGGTIGYANQKSDNFSNLLTSYPANVISSADYRRTWIKGNPNHHFSYQVYANYCYVLPINMLIYAGYSVEQSIRRLNNDIYRMDWLSGWEYGTEHSIGEIPMPLDLQNEATDSWNSFISKENDITHSPTLAVNWEDQGKNERESWKVFLKLPLKIVSNQLRYKRATFDGTVKRNSVFLNPTLLLKKDWHNHLHGLQFDYSYSPGMPQLNYLIELENTINPTYIYQGNENLTNFYKHSMQLNYYCNSRNKQRFFSSYIHYEITDNDIQYGYMYDRTMGIYHYKPYNTESSYLLSGSISYSMPLDRSKKLTASTRTYGQLYHRNLMMGVISENPEPQRSGQSIYWVTENLNLDYSIGNWKVGLNGYIGWNQARSKRNGFKTINVYDYHFGTTVQAQLPWNMQISSDLTLYERSGYNAEALNDHNLVWNARLTKNIPKIGLTIAVDGFDILGNLSNITQSMNSQGRTETWRNSIPRYFLVHAIYRFHYNPKNISK